MHKYYFTKSMAIESGQEHNIWQVPMILRKTDGAICRLVSCLVVGSTSRIRFLIKCS